MFDCFYTTPPQGYFFPTIVKYMGQWTVGHQAPVTPKPLNTWSTTTIAKPSTSTTTGIVWDDYIDNFPGTTMNVGGWTVSNP